MKGDVRSFFQVPDEAVRNMVDRESAAGPFRTCRQPAKDGMRRCLGPAAVVAGLLAAAGALCAAKGGGKMLRRHA